MQKAAELEIPGTRLKMKSPVNSAGPTAPPISCVCRRACTSPGKMTRRYASTPMPEPRRASFTSVRLRNPQGNRHGRDTPPPSGKWRRVEAEAHEEQAHQHQQHQVQEAT